MAENQRQRNDQPSSVLEDARERMIITLPDFYSPTNWESINQLYHSREPVNQFLVCWPDRMAEVNFDSGWTITEDMMSTAAEALKNA